jgi:hypothetical protein
MPRLVNGNGDDNVLIGPSSLSTIVFGPVRPFAPARDMLKTLPVTCCGLAFILGFVIWAPAANAASTGSKATARVVASKAVTPPSQSPPKKPMALSVDQQGGPIGSRGLLDASGHVTQDPQRAVAILIRINMP